MLQLTVPLLPRSWFKVPGVEDVAVIISVLRITGPTGLVLWTLLTGNIGTIVTGAQLAGLYLGRRHGHISWVRRERKGHLALCQPGQEHKTEKRKKCLHNFVIEIIEQIL